MSYGELGRTAKASLIYGATLAKSMVLAGHGDILHEEREIADELGGKVVGKWSTGRYRSDMNYLSFCHGVCIDMGMAPSLLVPGNISTKEVSEAFGVAKGNVIDLPRSHFDLAGEDDIKAHIDLLKEVLEYKVPIMVKFTGGEVYEKVRCAIEAGADAIVLEGMRAWRARNMEATAEHVGEPLPAMMPPAMRAFIDTKAKARGVRLLVQGGIMSGEDTFKAIAMGADAVGLDCAALVAIGCKLLGGCHTNKCPQGIATVDPKLEAKVNFKQAGEQLANLMRTFNNEAVSIARQVGLCKLSEASMTNLRALTYDAAAITGVRILGFDRSLPLWVQ
jgi:glutamate synthase domain-containing protein 2